MLLLLLSLQYLIESRRGGESHSIHGSVLRCLLLLLLLLRLWQTKPISSTRRYLHALWRLTRGWVERLGAILSRRSSVGDVSRCGGWGGGRRLARRGSRPQLGLMRRLLLTRLEKGDLERR